MTTPGTLRLLLARAYSWPQRGWAESRRLTTPGPLLLLARDTGSFGMDKIHQLYVIGVMITHFGSPKIQSVLCISASMNFVQLTVICMSLYYLVDKKYPI